MSIKRRTMVKSIGWLVYLMGFTIITFLLTTYKNQSFIDRTRVVIIDNDNYNDTEQTETIFVNQSFINSTRAIIIDNDTNTNTEPTETIFVNHKPSNTEKIDIPSWNRNKTIYVMNTIYLPHDQLLSIHLLGKQHWGTTDNVLRKTIIRNWANYTKFANISIYCLFPYNSMFLSSKIVIVPEVLHSEHKQSTQTFLCKIPEEIMKMHLDIHNDQIYYQFILMTSDKLINVELEYNIKERSMLPLLTNSKNNNINSSKHRFLSLCMPRISDPMPFIQENVAYYISQGFEHIYIGTHFSPSVLAQRTEILLNLLKPWYDAGQITLMNFFLPKPIRMSSKFLGQPQFIIQCLYLSKSFGDEFTLNTDTDEFLVFHNNLTIYHNLKYKYYDDIKDKCWIVFDSYNVWKLTNPNSLYMVPRYTEINGNKKELANYCKTLWNNKYLWSTEVHSGGACNISNTFGFNWNHKINNYKDWSKYRKYNKPNPTKLVKIMNVEYEASIRHFKNAIKLRTPWIPTNFSVNDSCALNEIIWNNIKQEFSLKAWNHSTFNVNNSKYNILYKDDYQKLFGKGNSMKIIKSYFNYTHQPIKWKGSDWTTVIPHYESLCGINQ